MGPGDAFLSRERVIIASTNGVGSDNGLVPLRREGIILTNDDGLAMNDLVLTYCHQSLSMKQILVKSE